MPIINILNTLVGNQVSKSLAIEDYIQLFFENGDVLNIYNRYVLEPGSVTLEGRLLERVIETNNALTLEFVDQIKLVIDLKDSGYQGPEAIQLNRSNGQIIIWPDEPAKGDGNI
jgi:hypothetical protein